MGVYPEQEEQRSTQRISFVWTTRVYAQLVAFALIYGFLLINFVDYTEAVNGPGRGWYHLWLFVMYFAPFALLRIFVKGERRVFLGLGLLVSLMNDGLWPLWLALVGADSSYIHYVIDNWFTFSPKELFSLQLGLVQVPVYGYTMTASLWLRILSVAYLLNSRRIIGRKLS